jgi:hypothetical protein
MYTLYSMRRSGNCYKVRLALAQLGIAFDLVEVDILKGETRTPDFRLTAGGNPVPLQTTYHAIIDGGNGNTLLEPVEATLGRTRFAVRGGVVRGAGESGKTVALDVNFPEGYIEGPHAAGDERPSR